MEAVGIIIISLDPETEGYALAYDLLPGNTCFKKRDNHLLLHIGTQIDFVLFWKSLCMLVMDVKVGCSSAFGIMIDMML